MGDSPIRIRRVTEAVLQIGQVKTEHLGTASVTGPKLGEGSVTGSVVADGELEGRKFVPGTISGTLVKPATLGGDKFKQYAVTSDVVATDAITLIKAADDLKTHEFTGEETEVSVATADYVSIKEARFIVSTLNPASKIRVLGSLKTQASGTAHLGIFFNAEGSPRIELTGTFATSSIAYEMFEGECDITDLPAGRHTIAANLKVNASGSVAYNDHLDILVVK